MQLILPAQRDRRRRFIQKGPHRIDRDAEKTQLQAGILREPQTESSERMMRSELFFCHDDPGLLTGRTGAGFPQRRRDCCHFA